METKPLSHYIKRRLDSGETLSDVKEHLLKAGYTDNQIEQAFTALENHTIAREKVLSFNPQVFNQNSQFNVVKNQLKHYSKLLAGSGFVLLAGLVAFALKRIDFSGVVWKNLLIAGIAYLSAFAILVSVLSLLVYSVHRVSQAHSPLELSAMPVFLAATIGEVFTFIINRIMPTHSVWIPISLGCFIFVLLLLLNLDSKASEVISSSTMYCALTYFFYILMMKVYTYEKVLLLFGISG